MFVKVKLKVQVDNTGNCMEVPGLMTPAGLLTPLLDYFLGLALARSLSWMDKVVRSTQLFCEYMQANKAQRNTRLMFDNFAKALYSGTFDGSTGDDPSGLCWRPRRRKDARGIITDLTLIFDWLGANNPIAADINPLVTARAYEQRLNEAARLYKRENALLGHLWSAKNEDNPRRGRRVHPKGEPAATYAEPPAFPEDRFADLLNDGFRVGRRVDHRGICITLLMHGAGFRESEPFHLYVQDAMPDPSNRASALVRVHHPSDGYAPDGWRDPSGNGRIGIRSSYLMSHFGMKPRNKMLGSLQAGWKGGHYDADNYKQAHWFEPRHGELFLEHWSLYIEQLVRVKRDHPYLFANLAREPRGGMYKLSTFNDAHAAACRRIGLEPKKALGTTPHGHRHAYGQRLRRAGIGEKYIQIMLHHASPQSQEQYTRPGTREVADAIREGEARLRQSVAH